MGMVMLSAKDRLLALAIRRNLDKISMSGSPAEIFAALRPITAISGGMIGTSTEGKPESMVIRDVNLTEPMVNGFQETPREQRGLMFAPLFAAKAGQLVPATKGLSVSAREQIKLWQITRAEGYGETAGYKVSDPDGYSRRFVFMTLALEGPCMFTERDHYLLGVLQKPIYSALERLRVPLIPSEKVSMQMMEEREIGYVLVAQKSLPRCIEVNMRARALIERYAASVGIEADRLLVSMFAKQAMTQCSDGSSWVIVRKHGDAELKVHVHGLRPDSHNVGENVWLVTMEESIYPVDLSIFSAFGLTPREIEIVQLLVESEYTAKDIAEELGTSPHTVRTQIEKIRGKMGVKSRAALTAKVQYLRRQRRR